MKYKLLILFFSPLSISAWGFGSSNKDQKISEEKTNNTQEIDGKEQTSEKETSEEETSEEETSEEEENSKKNQLDNKIDYKKTIEKMRRNNVQMANYDSSKIRDGVYLIAKFKKQEEAISRKIQSFARQASAELTQEKQQQLMQLLQPFMQSQQNIANKIDAVIKSNIKKIALDSNISIVFDKKSLAYVDPAKIYSIDDLLINELNNAFDEDDFTIEAIDWDEIQMIINAN